MREDDAENHEDRTGAAGDADEEITEEADGKRTNEHAGVHTEMSFTEPGGPKGNGSGEQTPGYFSAGDIERDTEAKTEDG